MDQSHNHHKGVELYNEGLKYWEINDEFEQDKDQALKLFKRAASVYGNKDALYSLGQIYEFGQAQIYRNVQKAIYYYLLASEKGNKQAYYRLGQIYERGLGVPIDQDKAMGYYSKSEIPIKEEIQLKFSEKLKTLENKQRQPDINLQSGIEKESTTFRKDLMTDTYSESDYVNKEIRNKEKQQKLCDLCLIF